MRFVTDFADLAVLLPVAAIVCVGLLLAEWRRGAAAWAGCVGGTLGVMLALKLLFLGCAAHRPMSPSGHTAAGTIVYGGAVALLWQRRIGALLAGLVAAGSVAVLIAASRLALALHSPLEVAIGAAVGLTGTFVLLRLAGPPPGTPGARLIVPACLALMLLLHGTRLGAEARLRAVAGWMPDRICDL